MNLKNAIIKTVPKKAGQGDVEHCCNQSALYADYYQSVKFFLLLYKAESTSETTFFAD